MNSKMATKRAWKLRKFSCTESKEGRKGIGGGGREVVHDSRGRPSVRPPSAACWLSPSVRPSVPPRSNRFYSCSLTNSIPQSRSARLPVPSWINAGGSFGTTQTYTCRKGRDSETERGADRSEGDDERTNEGLTRREKRVLARPLASPLSILNPVLSAPASFSL